MRGGTVYRQLKSQIMLKIGHVLTVFPTQDIIVTISRKFQENIPISSRGLDGGLMMIEGPIGFGQGGTFMYKKVDSRIFEDGAGRGKEKERQNKGAKERQHNGQDVSDTARNRCTQEPQTDIA